MALKYSITHNGNTWNSSQDVDTLTIQNGSVTSSMTEAGTKVLNCAGKVASNNLVIGAKTLNCKDKIMTGNVTITTESAGWTLNFKQMDTSNLEEEDVLLNSLCYGTGGRVVAYDQYTKSFIYTDDGYTWQVAQEIRVNGNVSIIYGGNKYVAVSTKGTILYSSDGLSWTLANTQPGTVYSLYQVGYGNGKYFAGGKSTNETFLDGFCWYSTDASNWTLVYSGMGNSNPLGVGYLNNIYLFLGKLYFNTSSNLTSWNKTWNDDYETFSPRFCQVLDNKFVAGGSGALYTSTNGTTWTKNTMPASGSYSFICYGDGKYLTMANGEENILVSTSLNGPWEEVYQSVLGRFGFESMVYDSVNKRYIAYHAMGYLYYADAESK